MLSSKVGKRKAANNGNVFLQKIIIMIFRPFFTRLRLIATSAEIQVWKTFFLWKRYNIDSNGHFRQHFKCSFKASKASLGNVQPPHHVWPANYLNLAQ